MGLDSELRAAEREGDWRASGPAAESGPYLFWSRLV